MGNLFVLPITFACFLEKSADFTTSPSTGHTLSAHLSVAEVNAFVAVLAVVSVTFVSFSVLIATTSPTAQTTQNAPQTVASSLLTNKT